MTDEERLADLERRLLQQEQLMIRVAAIVAVQAGIPREKIDQMILEVTAGVMRGKGET